MTKKLQSYYVLKLETDRIKKSNYHVTVTPNQARESDELVTLGDSEVLRSLRRIKNKKINTQEQIDELFRRKRVLRYQKDSPENRSAIKKIQAKIDSILFVPEIVSVSVNDHRHYLQMVKKGFWVNGKKYSRFLCGAGNARRNTVFFLDNDYIDEMNKVMNNGRDNVSLLPSKYNAYFALANSATIRVSTPSFCVIPDYEFQHIRNVEYITDNDDGSYTVLENEISVEVNAFDGQGLISPKQSAVWAEEMELDYTPAAFCIRSNFLKGMVCTFDFHRFSKEVANKHIITDAWDNPVDIDNVDVILSVSQFKLWNAYGSCESYIEKSNSNNLGWGISRVTPKYDKDVTNTNYQFLQVLDIDDNQIEGLCQTTIDYFHNVAGGDVRHTILHLLGKGIETPIDQKQLDSMDDPVLKSLIYNNDLVHDSYVRNLVNHTLNKKIRDNYTGVLLVPGNYQVMISDPYAMAEYMFGMPVNGLLKENEHYSAYWNNKNVNKVVSMRAPLTWKSEANILNLKINSLTEEWYNYLNSGIVYNIHGSDTMLHADSD